VKKKLFYARSESFHWENPIYEIKMLESIPFVKAAFRDDHGNVVEIISQLFGKYNFANIMTAIVLGRYFKVPPHKIKSAIEHYQPLNNRSQIRQVESNTFILDAYNANPSSMEQAIVNFQEMPGANKIAILGDMLELGEASAEEHENIGKLALAQGFQHTIFVGEEFQTVAQRQGELHFQNVTKLREWFEQQYFINTFFLLKGSRGMQLEKLLAEEVAH
jgi:UDP-N-acetylmuramoyl-tripeptide--D-alanyl-D-alanine ligase